MSLKILTQRALQVSTVDDYLLNWLEAFLIDRKASGVAAGTLRFYRQKIKLFTDYCDAQAVKQIGQITPSFLRQFLNGTEQVICRMKMRARTVRDYKIWPGMQTGLILTGTQSFDHETIEIGSL